MWVPSLILFLTWFFKPAHTLFTYTNNYVGALFSHIVSHLVSHVAAPSFKPDHTLIVYVYEQLWRCPPPLIPAPILFLAQSLWDGGKFKERFVAYGPSPASGSVYKLRYFFPDFMKEMFVCLWPADKIVSGEVADHFELSRFHHCIVKCSIVAL